VEVFAVADAVSENALDLGEEVAYISPFDGATFVVYTLVMTPTPDIFFLASSFLQGIGGYIRFYNFSSEAGIDSFYSRVCSPNFCTREQNRPDLLIASFYGNFVCPEDDHPCLLFLTSLNLKQEKRKGSPVLVLKQSHRV